MSIIMEISAINIEVLFVQCFYLNVNHTNIIYNYQSKYQVSHCEVNCVPN